MSSSKTPQKGDIIINPNTQRPIRVGGRAWLGLVKKGIIEGHYTSNKTVQFEEPPLEEPPEVQEPPVLKPQRRRNKRATRTAKLASRVVSENIDELIEAGDNFNDTLEEMIMREMMSESTIEYDPVEHSQSEQPDNEPEPPFEEQLEPLQLTRQITKKRRGRPAGSKNKPKFGSAGRSQSDQPAVQMDKQAQWELEEPTPHFEEEEDIYTDSDDY